MEQPIGRRTWKAELALERLEARRLLSTQATASSPTALASGQASSTDVRQLSYTTPQGSHVDIQIFGVGSLAGSSVDGGVLHLVIGGTNFETGIIGKVSGGTGQAALGSVQYSGVSPDDLSGVGGTLLNILNLKDFNLVDGGTIDLEAGVHAVFLNSIGSNSQLHIRETPELIQSNTTSTTANGLSLGFITSVLGSQTLSTVGGQFIATAAPPATAATHHPGPPPAPPGAVFVIHHVRGTPRIPAQLGDPQIFGYDPTAGNLVRFDVHFDPNTGAGTGTPNLSIPLPGPMIAGVTLARVNGELVALVSNGDTVYAYNATATSPQGALVGSFTINPSALNLPNFTRIDEMGSTGILTVLGDSTGGPNGQGVLQGIDVAQSLATGQAVPEGAPFVPTREFELFGGLTGVSASPDIFALGAGHFDQFQPNLTQYGILAVNTQVFSNGQLATQMSEVGRGPILSKGATINAGPMGTAQSNPVGALGSIDQSLAVRTGVSNGQNIISLYGPQNLASEGTVTLADSNPLAGLSESFHTNLAGSALVDVQGNVQSFRADDVQGLVLNVAGNLNLFKAGTAANSVVIGQPFGHVDVLHRSNLTVISNARVVGTRSGVTIEPALRQAGPLSIP